MGLASSVLKVLKQAIALKDSLGKLSRFVKILQRPQNLFSCLTFVDYSIILLLYKYYNSRDCIRNATDYLAGIHSCIIIHSTYTNYQS